MHAFLWTVVKVLIASLVAGMILNHFGITPEALIARSGMTRERLEELGVRVADASEFAGGLINHDLFLSNTEVQQVVKRSIERERG